MSAPVDAVVVPMEAGSYSDEDAYNCDTDKYDKRKIRVACPKCGNESSPLCSSKTRQTDSGWRWVGCDHKEPYARFETTCSKCKSVYRFGTHTPQ